MICFYHEMKRKFKMPLIRGLQQHLFMILQEITTLIKKKSVLHSMQMLLFSRMNRS